jgi:hypothetical protein
MAKYTCILIAPETRERLKAAGKKGQTYSQLIDELLKSKVVPTPLEAKN